MRIVLGLVWVLVGCSLDRGFVPGEVDAGPSGIDAAAGDSGAPGEDGGPRDGGPSPDAGPPPADGGPPPVDAGPGCTAAQERCDGNDTLLCVGDDLVRTPCGSSATCVDTGTPTCEPHLCTPGSVECNMDATGIETCAADGLSSTPTPCARGCATNACRPETACANTVQGAVGIGTTLAIDLCTGSSDYDVDPVIGCPRGANGNDRLYRLELDRSARLRIEVNVTSATATDPVVTLRSACAVETSQTHCDSNDGPGLQPRLDVDLGAGDYFLVVDSYDYTFMSTTYVCGQVELRITER